MTWTARTRWLAAALAVTVALAFAPAISGPFNFDDDDAILMNESIMTLWPPGWLNAPRGKPTAARPVANLSFAINFWINDALGVTQGVDTPGPRQSASYHVGNILIHLCAGLVLFGLLQRTLAGRAGDWWRAGRARSPSTDAVAAAITAIWLLHPIHGDAVNYVTQRTEVLMAFFYLGTLYAAARAWETTTDKSRTRWYAVSVVSCLLGMATKEVMVSAPLMVVLYDRAFRVRSWRELRPRRNFYLALASTIVLLALLQLTTPRASSVGFQLGMPWYQYLYTQAWLIGRYALLSIWPDRLTADYGIRVISDWRGIPGFLALSALLLATLMAWKRANTRGWFGFLGAWFFLILGPSSSFVPIITEVGAERRFYLPLVALVVLGAVMVEAGRRRFAARDATARRRLTVTLATVGIVYAVLAGWRATHLTDTRAIALLLQASIGALAALFAWRVLRGPTLRPTVLALLAVLAATTFVRSRTYGDDIRLWRDATVKAPTNARTWETLGVALLNRDHARYAAEAEAMFKKAIAVDPLYPPGYLNAATSAIEAGRTDDARGFLELVIRLAPKYSDALAALGGLYLAEGDVGRALPLLERAGQAPLKSQTLVDLATAYVMVDRPDDAFKALTQAYDMEPTRTELLQIIGALLLRSGKPADAVPALEEAVRREPTSGHGLALLAAAYAQTGRGPQAIEAATAAAQAGGDDAQVMLFAARAMLGAGDSVNAEGYIARAAQLAPQDLQVLTDLGQIKLALGKRADAVAAFRRALAVDPNSEAAKTGLAAAGGR